MGIALCAADDRARHLPLLAMALALELAEDALRLNEDRKVERRVDRRIGRSRAVGGFRHDARVRIIGMVVRHRTWPVSFVATGITG